MPLSQFYHFFLYSSLSYYITFFIIINLIILLIYNLIELNWKQILLLYLSLTLSFYIYRDVIDFEQIIFSIYIILFLIFFIKREKEYHNNGNRFEIFAALTLGFTFLIRSTLIILPVFIIIYDLLTKGRKISIKKTFIILLIPYSLLIPWSLYSKFLIGKVLFTEINRASMNIITGALGTTLTGEGDIVEVLGADEKINSYSFALKIISAKPLNYMVSILRRLWYFVSINWIMFIPALISFYLNRKSTRIKILMFFILFFVAIHILFSVEKRYFFPVSLILSIITAGSLNERDNENEYEPKFKPVIFFIILSLPVIFTLYKFVLYPISEKKDIEVFISENKKINPDLYLIAAINKIRSGEREKAIAYLEKFHKTSKDPLKKNVEELLNVLDGKDEIINTSQPFNIVLIKVLLLIKENKIQDAKEMIKNYWTDISQSYMRSTMTETEISLDYQIRKYIKKDALFYDNFLIAATSYSEAKNICKKFNSLIKEYGSNENLDCNLEEKNTAQKIKAYCKNDIPFEKLMEIIELESKQSEVAKDKIKKLIKEKPSNYKLYTEYGNICMIEKKYQKARFFYEKAIDLCPYAKDSYYGLDIVYKKLNLEKERIRLKERAKKFSISIN